MAFDQAPGTADLEATRFLDVDEPTLRAYVARAADAAQGEIETAARLFAAVRDDIRYDPYDVPTEPERYRASAVLAARRGYCVQKAVLLSAAARAAGIPARVGFADVRNHLQSERLRAVMQTDLFHWHGYSALFVGGRWLKASPAFNIELCERFGVPPLEFDGVHDALLHPFAADGSQYMEYLDDHGVFRDLPLEALLAAYREAYGAASLLRSEPAAQS